jgi:hypothetical protein
MLYSEGYAFTSRKELSDALYYFYKMNPSLSIDRIAKAFINKKYKIYHYDELFNMKTKRPGYNFIRNSIQR